MLINISTVLYISQVVDKIMNSLKLFKLMLSKDKILVFHTRTQYH